MRFTKPKKVSTLDLRSFIEGNKQDQQNFIFEFGTGLREYGFVIVEGHGVSGDLVQSCYAHTKAFFNLPQETKNQFVIPKNAGQRGYTQMKQEHAKDSQHPDIKEFWHVGRESFTHAENSDRYPKNIWPTAHIPMFKEDFTELYSQLETMASTLLQATSLYLQLPKNTLKHDCRRQQHYPCTPLPSPR